MGGGALRPRTPFPDLFMDTLLIDLLFSILVGWHPLYPLPHLQMYGESILKTGTVDLIEMFGEVVIMCTRSGFGNMVFKF